MSPTDQEIELSAPHSFENVSDRPRLPETERVEVSGDALDGGSCRFDSASWVAKATFAWLTPLLEGNAAANILDAGIAPRLPQGDAAEIWAKRMEEALCREEMRGSSFAWLLAYLRVFWPFVVAKLVWSQVSHLLHLLAITLDEGIVSSLESQEPHGSQLEGSVLSGWFSASGAVTLAVAQTVLNAAVGFYFYRIELRINSALVGTVLQRSLCPQKLAIDQARDHTIDATSHGAGGGGAVFNLITLDVGPSIDSVDIVMTFAGLPLQLCTTIAMLYNRVQWAWVPGLAMMIMLKMFSTVLMVYHGRFRHELLKRKDVRLANCSEAFVHVRNIQMLGWLEPFQRRILDARERELATTRSRLFLSKTNEGVNYVSGHLLTLAIFAYYTLASGQLLKASQAMVVMALANDVGGPLGAIPQLLERILVCRSAHSRVAAFIASHAKKSEEKNLVDRDSDAVFFLSRARWHWPETIVETAIGCSGSAQSPSRSGASVVRPPAFLRQSIGESSSGNVSSAPLLDCEGEVGGNNPISSFVLGPVDLHVRRGDLVLVTGQTGAGKTSFLQALLGEMPRLSDGESMRCPRGPLPFLARSPVLFSGSVRSNITFGLPFDQSALSRVIDVCDLAADLAEMAHGIDTDVVCGQAVSTGQRCRIAMARALYLVLLRGCDVLLMDDPFASIDKHTRQRIAKALFESPGALASGFAAIVCTSSPSDFDTFGQARELVLDSGKVVDILDFVSRHPKRTCGGEIGVGSQTSDSKFAAVIASDPLSCDVDRSTDATNFDGDQVDCTSKDVQCVNANSRFQPISKEEVSYGQVQAKVYRKFALLTGFSGIASIVIVIAGIMAFQQFCDMWLSFLKESSQDNEFPLTLFGMSLSTKGWRESRYLAVYAGLVGFFCVFNFSGFWLEVCLGVRAAKRVFEEAITVLARPLCWWDQQPQGRVMNRFIADVSTVDGCMTCMVGVVSGAVLYFVGHVGALALTNPWSLLVIPPLLYCCERVAARFYRRSIREFKRLELVSSSPLDQAISELTDGPSTTTIRALGADGHALQIALSALDRLQRAKFVRDATDRWLGIRLDLVGQVLAAFIKFLPLFSQHEMFKASTTAGMVSFSMRYSSQLMGITNQLIRNFSEVEMQLLSIERLEEYSSPQQANCYSSPPASWPRSGALELRDIWFSYGGGADAGVPLIIRGANLSLRPLERVALIGRTGAGKSTLLKAILHLIPLKFGSVLVDGVSLGDVSPADRRKAVAMVPQTPVVFVGSLRHNIDPLTNGSAERDVTINDALKRVGIFLRDSGSDSTDPLARERSWGGNVCGLTLDTEFGLGTASVDLTAGQKQLIGLARATLSGAKVLLLDEVTAGLDAQTAISVAEAMKPQLERCTSIIVTHQAELLSLCTSVIRFSDGQLRWENVSQPAAAE